VKSIGAAQLILRAAIGGTMVTHGIKHGRTLDGTARWFDSIGFRQARLQAAASAAVETGAGAAVLAGAATPLSAAAVVGTMAVAARSVHLQNGFFITGEGYAGRHLRVYGPPDQSVAFEGAQCLGEHLLAHSRQPLPQLGKPARPVLAEFAQHENRPFAADLVEQIA